MRFSQPFMKYSAAPPVEHSSHNETVLGSSRKMRGVAEQLIDGSEKRICWLSFELKTLKDL